MRRVFLPSVSGAAIVIGAMPLPAIEKRPAAKDSGREVRNMRSQQPIAKFKCGSVTAALWLNEVEIRGSLVPMLKASVERRFRANDGSWKSSNSFSRNELPFAVWCLQRSFDEIVRRENENSRETAEEGVVK